MWRSNHRAGATAGAARVVRRHRPIRPVVTHGSRVDPARPALVHLPLVRNCVICDCALFKLGRLLRCIPLIVLKAALTGVGVYMVVEAIKMGVAWKEEGGMSEGETTVFLTETARAGSQLFGPPARPLLLATLLTLAGYIIVKKLGFSQSQSLGYLAAVAIAINALTLGGVCCSAAPGIRDPGWYFGGDEEGEAQASALGLLTEFRPSEVLLPVLATALPYTGPLSRRPSRLSCLSCRGAWSPRSCSRWVSTSSSRRESAPSP